MTVVENHGDDAFLARIVPRLLAEPLEEVARSAEIQSKWVPLRDAHLSFVDKVREKSQPMGSVVYVDLTETVIDVAGKFVTYALFPKSAYSVMVTRGRTRCKISVGYNPWSGVERRHDISQICRRHGGGGHAVVGAIALPPNESEKARKLGLDIVQELNG
jgi:nanoRNase/pAp phosphatase (c-di-AMP/oligoRNAs hydrolase)